MKTINYAKSAVIFSLCLVILGTGYIKSLEKNTGDELISKDYIPELNQTVGTYVYLHMSPTTIGSKYTYTLNLEPTVANGGYTSDWEKNYQRDWENKALNQRWETEMRFDWKKSDEPKFSGQFVRYESGDLIRKYNKERRL